MIFRSALERASRLYIWSSFIPMTAAAAVLGWFTNSLLVFAGAFAAFFAYEAFVFVVMTAVGALAWRSERDSVTRRVVEFLRANRFPVPNEYEDSAGDYFLRTSRDQTQPIDVRVKAATEAGTLSAFGVLNYFQRARLELTQASVEQALADYRAEFAARDALPDEGVAP